MARRAMARRPQRGARKLCVLGALVVAGGLRPRARPRPRATARAAAGRGFAAGATKKPRRKNRASPPSPPAPPSPAAAALDRWGLPVEPEDEDAPRDLGARKTSLAGPPVSVREAGAALARARAHPVDLADPKLSVLHLDPPVFRVAGFLSPGECADLIALTASGRCREMPKEAGTFAAGEALRRTSTTWYARYREPAVAPLLSRARRLLGGAPSSHFEELQLARYLPGERFKWHEDAVPPGLLRPGDGGQRVATLLVYLTGDGAAAGGGSTCFRDLGAPPPLRVAPVAGDALLFFPALHPGGRPDDRTVHAAEPARREKWVSQLWLHEAPYRRRADLPLTNRGDAAAATRICRGGASRRRRERRVDIPRSPARASGTRRAFSTTTRTPTTTTTRGARSRCKDYRAP